MTMLGQDFCSTEVNPNSFWLQTIHFFHSFLSFSNSFTHKIKNTINAHCLCSIDLINNIQYISLDFISFHQTSIHHTSTLVVRSGWYFRLPLRQHILWVVTFTSFISRGEDAHFLPHHPTKDTTKPSHCVELDSMLWLFGGLLPTKSKHDLHTTADKFREHFL